MFPGEVLLLYLYSQTPAATFAEQANETWGVNYAEVQIGGPNSTCISSGRRNDSSHEVFEHYAAIVAVLRLPLTSENR